MKCPICESDSVLERMFGSVSILRCAAANCGFHFFDLSQWKSPYVTADYYPGEMISDTLTPMAPWIQARVEIVERFKNEGNVAELGCGLGETAIALKNAGYNVAGVEESRNAVNFLASRYPTIDWHQSTVMEFLRQNRVAFDVITMFHVLEHLPEPKQVVKLIDQSLKKDGIVVIEVPDVGGGWARIKGTKWDYYLDHHINYFDLKSLRRLFGIYGYRQIFLQKTYHFGYPQGNYIKDVIKGALAILGMNSIIRTVWRRDNGA